MGTDRRRPAELDPDLDGLLNEEPDEELDSEFDADLDSEFESESDAEFDSEFESESDAELESDSDSDSGRDTKQEPELEILTSELRAELNPDVLADEPFATRAAEALRVAEALYKLMKEKPNWIIFFREILGAQGALRQLFPVAEEMIVFERTLEFNRIQQMIADLRVKTKATHETEKVITVRLPASVHESLRAEAQSLGVSMNKLCISKLLQFIEISQIPRRTPK